MQFRLTVEQLIRQYGQAITLTKGGVPSSFRAFLQPLRYKNKLYLEGTPTELGVAEESFVQYLGPALPAPDAHDPHCRIACGAEEYSVRHSETVRVCEEPLYTRAILRRIQKEE